ncbi:MAG: DNA polymerase/3'-5' exonuclease PolX [Thermaerobacter sp.]|nr:DNA polymerase/3'-5' exonuclease PolX [Thermaerobacter sp.]
MDRQQVAEAFEEMADLLEFRGEEPFKVRAYRRGAEAVRRSPEELAVLRGEGRLHELPGIGKALEEKIGELLDRGTFRALEELKRSVPAGMEELLAVPGLGPKTAARLYRELGIKDRAGLAAALEQKRLRDLPGMGERREQQLREALAARERLTSRHPLSETLPLAEALVEEVRRLPGVRQVAVAGSIRRFRDTTGDIDLVAEAADPEAVGRAFAASGRVSRVLALGEVRARVVLAEGIQADLWAVAPGGFPAALHHATGSKNHSVRLRSLARQLGLTLNEYGIFRGEESLAVRSEEDIYRHLGLPFIPPELREDSGEIEAALAGELPELLNPADILGDLHVHTDWSDGQRSVDEMAAAARELGYRYLAICDHSRSLGVAHGLDGERLARQREEIAAVNAAHPEFRLLAGVEVDIRMDGSLDLPDAVLAQLDFVTASIHAGLGADRTIQTRRLVRAMENPHVDAIGHPTGRLLGRREPYELDLEEVVAAAARTGTALELNAQLSRLDLSTEHLRLARERGVQVVVNSDAHGVEGLRNMAFGVRSARRGWLGRAQVRNARPWTAG